MRYLPAKKSVQLLTFCSYNLGISVLLLRSSKAVIAQIYLEAACIRPRKGSTWNFNQFLHKEGKLIPAMLQRDGFPVLYVLSCVSAFCVYCITVYNHYKSVKNKNSEVPIEKWHWNYWENWKREVVSHQLQEAQSQKLLVLNCAKETGIWKSLIGIITYHHIPVLAQTMEM